MFETVEQLNRNLPRPAVTGDPIQDRQAQERYISNAKALQSEAFACLARSVFSSLRNLWRHGTTWNRQPNAHQV